MSLPTDSSGDLRFVGNTLPLIYGTWVIDPMEQFTHPNLCLKMYCVANGTGIPKGANDLHDKLRTAFVAEVEQGRLKPFSGMGFAIESEEMVLNVCRWHNGYNRAVIAPQLYALQVNQSPRSVKLIPERVEDVGAFCDLEKEVYDFEQEQWIKFLRSSKSEADKRTYLETRCSKGYVLMKEAMRLCDLRSR